MTTTAYEGQRPPWAASPWNDSAYVECDNLVPPEHFAPGRDPNSSDDDVPCGWAGELYDLDDQTDEGNTLTGYCPECGGLVIVSAY